MMLRKVYGVCHTTYLEFLYLCQSQALNFGYVTPQGVRKEILGEDVVPFPLYFQSLPLLLRIKSRLKKPCVGFVPGNPLTLREWGIPLIGARPAEGALFRYELLPVRGDDIRKALSDLSPAPLRYTPALAISQLLKIASGKSVLAPTQTALYAIKDSSIRGWIQACFFDWLANEFSNKEFVTALEVLDDNAREYFTSLVANPKMSALRKAAHMVLRQGLSYEIAEQEFGVADYDLKYICHRHKKNSA